MTEHLVERLKSHHGTIAKLLSISSAPGLSLGVFHHGQLIHTAHMGRRSINSPEPPNDGSVYFLASTFKIITACTVGRLVSSGHLTWDAPIHEYLPELKRRDTFGLQATVRDLLANRTGLPMARFYWGQQAGEQLLPQTEFAAIVDVMKTVKPFRSTFIYSQWNYCLLQLIVERVTGQSFGTHVRETIFGPLGLTTATFDNPTGTNVVSPHAALSDGSSVIIPIGPYNSTSGLTAGTGGKAGLKDQLQLYIALLAAYQDQMACGTDYTLNSPFKHLRTIFSPHIACPGSTLDKQAYCLGTYRTKLPGNLSCASLNGALSKKYIPMCGASDAGGGTDEVFHHTGNCPGYIGAMILVPRTQSGVVVLSNATPLMDAPDYCAQLLLSEVMDVKPPRDLLESAARSAKMQLSWYTQTKAVLESFKSDTPPTRPLSSYTGTYFNKIKNFKITITEDQLRNGLHLSCQGLPKTTYNLEPFDGDTFCWTVDRDAEVRRGSWIDPLPQFHVVNFEVDRRGVQSLSWQHDHRMEADMFWKGEGEGSAKL